MIRKSNGEFVAECVECGAEFYGGVEDDFHRFIDAMKAEGWRIRNDGGEWQHFCDDCFEGL